jgi:putative phosphoribosyl transferase
MFRDRKDAGAKLAGALSRYANSDALVLAIPRGGVEVAKEIADALDLDLSIVIVRKLPLPHNPEAGFGAIAEDGSVHFQEEIMRALDPKVVERVMNEQEQEVQRRIDLYRNGKPLPPIEGRHVILVDDGIAMGSTMTAAVLLLRNKKAGWITVAAPVSGPEIAEDMESIADEAVILETPPFFRAVAQVYQNWYDVPDSEVTALLKNR